MGFKNVRNVFFYRWAFLSLIGTSLCIFFNLFHVLLKLVCGIFGIVYTNDLKLSEEVPCSGLGSLFFGSGPSNISFSACLPHGRLRFFFLLLGKLVIIQLLSISQLALFLLMSFDFFCCTFRFAFDSMVVRCVHSFFMFANADGFP